MKTTRRSFLKTSAACGTLAAATTRADERIIFDTPLDERWTAAARKLGVTDPSQIAGYAGHA